MKAIVTGGAGFIGSHLVRALVDRGDDVTVIDDMSHGCIENLSGVVCKVSMGSVCNPHLLACLFKDADLVFHLAARGMVVSSGDPYADMNVNTLGTLNVLTAAKEAHVKKVIYTSTSSVYGNARHLPVNEDDGVDLLSYYAVSKYAAEGYCRVFYDLYDLPVAIVRFSNVYGARQRYGLIANILNSVDDNRPVVIHGDGQQTRDFTYIDDAISAVLTVADSPKSSGEVFNISTGVETKVIDVARLIAPDAEIKHIDRRDIDNIRRRVISAEKLRRVLHWVPKYSLEEGLKAMAG